MLLRFGRVLAEDLAEKPVHFETRVTLVDCRERREGGMARMYRYVLVCARKGRGTLKQWGSLVLQVLADIQRTICIFPFFALRRERERQREREREKFGV